jgi:hypothetical protein
MYIDGGPLGPCTATITDLLALHYEEIWRSGGIISPFLTFSPNGGEWSVSDTVSVIDECTDCIKRRLYTPNHPNQNCCVPVMNMELSKLA